MKEKIDRKGPLVLDEILPVLAEPVGRFAPLSGPGLSIVLTRIDCKHLSGVATFIARPNGKSAHTLLDKWSASRAIIKARV